MEVIKFVEVEKIVEKLVESTRIVEVEKIVEVIKEVEKIVQIGGGNESDCDCLTGAGFINIWNRIFKIQGIAGSACLTETQFIDLVSQSMISNVDSIEKSPTRGNKQKSAKVKSLLASPVNKALSPSRSSKNTARTTT
jgi:hypothetical protein